MESSQGRVCARTSDDLTNARYERVLRRTARFNSKNKITLPKGNEIRLEMVIKIKGLNKLDAHL
jgi:hypothetical protein